ncbi:HNH endonuclease [Candidatus Pacearchaeota archaeon]|nr:HNH endonuclease [Candidatus Pacearchaeota archaeon]
MKKEVRQQLYGKYGGLCAYCGEKVTLKNMQVEHIIPKRYFSKHYYCNKTETVIVTDYDVDDMKNLNPSCRPCNNFKGVWSLEEFRFELEQQLQRARRYSVNFRMAEKFGLIQAEEKPIVFHFENHTLANNH